MATPGLARSEGLGRAGADGRRVVGLRGILAVADRGYVMETGRIAMSGPAEALMADDRVREAYLGV